MLGWLFRQKRTPDPWWKLYPVRGCRLPHAPGARDRPDPRLAVGAAVRLRGKPDLVRRVLEIEWHRIRREYCYVVETSAVRFRPYWFAGQLEVAEAEAAAPGDRLR
jgi:hypothetical protein